MDKAFIESQYIKMLAFSYGDVGLLINELSKWLSLYKNAKNQDHTKIKYRIELYSELIKYSKNEQDTNRKEVVQGNMGKSDRDLRSVQTSLSFDKR